MKISILFLAATMLTFLNSFAQDGCATSFDYGNNTNASHYALVNGIKMYYEEYGDPSKPTLLLIHGNGGSVNSERCQIEYFNNMFHVIIADNRYQGKSEAGNKELTYELMTKDYNALLNHLKLDSVNIIGQSDGAILGLLLAIRYPNKVKRLAAMVPNLRPDSTALYPWAVKLNTKELNDVKDKIKAGDNSPELLQKRALLNLIEYYPNIKTEELSKIKAEVLMMSSDEDAITLEHMVEMYRAIPKAQLLVMPGTTHMALRQEYQLFNQMTERFLTEPFKRPTTKQFFVE